MLPRWIAFCLTLTSFTLLVPVRSDAAQDPDAVRASLEGQFSDLDVNDDGLLEEQEMGRLAPEQLESLYNNGLPAVYPLPREVYIAAGMAAASSMMEDMAVAVVESTARKIEVAKALEAKVPDKANPKLVTIRSAQKKSHYVPELPAEFNARDKNGDGQIALYEWDRKKYAEFAKLDKNGDGFLTPAELLPKGALKTLYARAPEPGKGSPGGERGRDGERSRDGERGRDSNGNGGPPTSEDSSERDARNIFGRLDENKDGMIDETEWARSRQTRGWLEQAGVSVSLPFSADTLVGYVRRAKESTGR